MGSKLSSDGFDQNQNHFERLAIIAPIRIITAPSLQVDPYPSSAARYSGGARW